MSAFSMTVVAMQARALVKASDWMTLSSQDQLNIARKENQAFQGWEEGVLSFPPTYKFKRGTSQYVGELCALGHLF